MLRVIPSGPQRCRRRKDSCDVYLAAQAAPSFCRPARALADDHFVALFQTLHHCDVGIIAGANDNLTLFDLTGAQQSNVVAVIAYRVAGALSGIVITFFTSAS